MNRTHTHGFTNYFAIGIGLFLLIEGIWALFSPVVFGIFTANVAHALVHIVLGLAGLWIGYSRDDAHGYCTFLGVLLLASGILFFLPGIGAWYANVFNANASVAYLNIIIGVASLLVSFMSGRPHIHTTRPA